MVWASAVCQAPRGIELTSKVSIAEAMLGMAMELCCGMEVPWRKRAAMLSRLLPGLQWAVSATAAVADPLGPSVIP